jgi:alkylhydroperoxidase family enzyme
MDAGSTPRLSPLARGELGPLARIAAAVTARATGGEPPRVITTLARHRRLFRRWLPFGAGLLRGDLPGPDRELVVLRAAWLSGAWYEWCQHATLARRAGVGEREVERVPAGPRAPGWSERQRLLLTATDELCADHVIVDATWARLARELSERELIELCLLVGHYAMLALALNSLGVEPEDGARRRLPPAAAAVAEQLRARLAAARAGTPPA